MAISASTLMDEVKCLCAAGGSNSEKIIIGLLQRIAEALEGSGGSVDVSSFFQEGNYAGGEPTFTPTGDVGIGIDTSTAPATIWHYYNGQWN